MENKWFKRLPYFIGCIIVLTLAVQVYWNVQNFQVNKQRLLNEVQISLDNAVEAYYATMTKNNLTTFIAPSKSSFSVHHDFCCDPRQKNTVVLKKDSSSVMLIADSLFFLHSNPNFRTRIPSSVSFLNDSNTNHINEIRNLAQKIIISIENDNLDLEQLNAFVTQEFNRKQLGVAHAFVYKKQDSSIQWQNNSDRSKLVLSTFSKSTYLSENESLGLLFSNPTLSILKRGMTGILASFILSLTIIGSLFLLLHIIRKQKALSEIKNDLISNITHEFKTPIATAMTAIEGIKKFNKNNDKEKTKNYLEISNQQMQKLNDMVEKLLETATLDSDKLLIRFEPVDLVPLIQQLVEKYRLICKEKELLFRANTKKRIKQLDPFHFENALANLIDNAIKYGGDKIQVILDDTVNDQVAIRIIDNGGGIAPAQKEKIFDKFYRIPKGNQHDVKGFGIGLFYTKKIIERHHGTIQLISDKSNTIFKVVL